jgi:hypothetical protein
MAIRFVRLVNLVITASGVMPEEAVGSALLPGISKQKKTDNLPKN